MTRSPSLPPPSSSPASPAPAAPTLGRAPALLAGTPREVLARIVPGDPLGLRPLVARRSRERALLVDTDRVLVRALALVAQEADRRGGALEDWLRARVDDAIDAVREDPDALGPGSGPRPGLFELLSQPLGLDTAGLRVACERFNRLPDSTREAFFALVLEGAPLQDVARAAGQPAPEVARRARGALDVFLPDA